MVSYSWSGRSERQPACPSGFSWSRSNLLGLKAAACDSYPVPMMKPGRAESPACACILPRPPIDALPGLRAVTPELTILRGVDLVVFPTQGNQPLEQGCEEPFSLGRGGDKWIAHDPVRHFAPALGKRRVAPDLGSEFEAPFVFDCSRHVDQLRAQIELQARFPLASVPDTPLVSIAPGP